LQQQELLKFFTRFRPVLEIILAPVQRMLGNICLGMMPLEREADYSQSRDVKIYDPPSISTPYVVADLLSHFSGCSK
jgi:hypothetical protein